MKRSVPFWQMTGFLVTAGLGTLLHFLFDWAHGNAVAALFSAVNESIWEHMKLLYYPMLVFSLVEYRILGKEYPAFWCVKLVGQLVGLTLIPMLYYSYTGALGVEADWFNIAIFFLTAAVVYRLEAGWLKKEKKCGLSRQTAVFFLLFIGILFTLFTFLPPQIPLFRDPVTGSYGFWRIGG